MLQWLVVLQTLLALIMLKAGPKETPLWSFIKVRLLQLNPLSRVKFKHPKAQDKLKINYQQRKSSPKLESFHLNISRKAKSQLSLFLKLKQQWESVAQYWTRFLILKLKLNIFLFTLELSTLWNNERLSFNWRVSKRKEKRRSRNTWKCWKYRGFNRKDWRGCVRDQMRT